MTQTIIWTIAILTLLGVVLAVVLYLVAKKFKVEEDPRIDEVEKVLPGANCGGCGHAGHSHSLALRLRTWTTISALSEAMTLCRKLHLCSDLRLPQRNLW